MIFETTILITCIKVLLIPAYFSTDFEVHRNWLAITHNLSPEKWYYENTSEWTLDYPPLFAWFEYILSHCAKLFDAEMLKIENLNYASPQTILFQRLSVIITDLVFAYGCCRCCKSFGKSFAYPVELFVILFGNVGLLMVDHIHFQYNGIMFGILLLSITNMMENKFRLSAFWFSTLLCMKHIFIYIAPAYFIYLLRHFCFTESNKNGRVKWNSFSIQKFIQLGGIVSFVVGCTFGPFYKNIPQVLSRLFPFKRGLCHAYWAPNIWALYNTADKAFTIANKKIGLIEFQSQEASMTGGLVQEYSFTVLPNITPIMTFILTFVFMVPILIKLWNLPKHYKNFHFVRAIVLCAAVSFMFGWHVHEKAIILLLIPISILAVHHKGDANICYLLAIIGNYSLFPLLFPPNLLCVKVLLVCTYILILYYILRKVYRLNSHKSRIITKIELDYLVGFIGLFLFEHFIDLYVTKISERLPFLPLLLTSVYCSIGIVYCCTKYYIQFLKIK